MQARDLLELIAVKHEIHLASIEMLPTTSLRLAIKWREHFGAANRSRREGECLGICESECR